MPRSSVELGPDAGERAERSILVQREPDDILFLCLRVRAIAAGVDNSRAHSAIEAWAGNLKNGLDEGLAFTAQWLGIADTVTASVSTDFAALTGSTDEAKIIGDSQKRGVSRRKPNAPSLSAEAFLVRILGKRMKSSASLRSNWGLNPNSLWTPVTGNVIGE